MSLSQLDVVNEDEALALADTGIRLSTAGGATVAIGSAAIVIISDPVDELDASGVWVVLGVQNRILPASDLAVDEDDGLLVFAEESQGCFDWRLDPTGGDARVWMASEVEEAVPNVSRSVDSSSSSRSSKQCLVRRTGPRPPTCRTRSSVT